ncbi:MAG TPA: TonB-dependent receptor [Caulobacter sp.]|nr:TonB-dependent receptor [Caulobacter sp.]
MGCLSTPALAQDENIQVEEIIVTAQKRSENLQDVPISVSATSGDKLEAQGIENLEDLSGYVPGVQIGKGAINTQINIRGVGSGSNRGFEQSVGMYVDGVYMGRDRQFRAPFMDLDRVEVLRGPQGTLFGRNTIGGAVSIITANPSLDGGFSGEAAARWDFDTSTLQLNGAATIPLGETAALRLAVQHRSGDGYIENATRGRDEPATEEFAARATLLWQPTDAFTANLKFSVLDSSIDGMNAVVTRFTKVTGVVTPPTALSNLLFANVALVEPDFSVKDPFTTYRDDPDVAGWSGREARIETRSQLGVLNMEYEVSDSLTLTSVTGYSAYETRDGLDLDFLPIRFIFRNEEQDFTQYSQELRLASDTGGSVDFMLGGYVETQELEQAGALLINSRLGFLPASAFAGGPTAAVYPLLPANVISRNSYFSQQTDTVAMFGELRWRPTDAVTVTLGGRWSSEDKDFVKRVWFGADASPQGLFTAPSSITQENVLLLYVKALDANNNLVDAVGRRKESGFDPSLKVQWDISDDVMAYATYSRGRKSGGFNGNDDQRLSNTASPWTALTPLGLSVRNAAYDPTKPGAGFEYDAETATSYEAGLKTRLLDGRAVLNLSAFFTQYEDLQVTVFQGASYVVANAKGSEIRGFEADGQLRLTSELTLSGSLAYLDFQFSDYANAGCSAQQISATPAPCVQDLSGKTNAFAPQWSGSLAIDWKHPVGDDLLLRVNADANYRGEHFLDYDLDPASLQGAQTRVNARVAFGSAEGSWEVSAFGRNLTDEVTFTTVNDIPLAPGGFAGFVQEPRTWGIELRARF